MHKGEAGWTYALVHLSTIEKEGSNMPKMELRKGESLDRALRRFKTNMLREGLVQEMRKREHYEKPSQQKRKQKEKAIRKAKRFQQTEEW